MTAVATMSCVCQVSHLGLLTSTPTIVEHLIQEKHRFPSREHTRPAT